MTERLVVLDDSKIRSMLLDPNMVREFPFMSGMSQKLKSGAKGGCGKCGKKNRQNQLDFEGIKTAIGGMPPDKLAKMKTMLNAENVRVKFRNVRGQLVKRNF